MTLTQNIVQWDVPGGDIAQTSLWVQYGGTPTAQQALARFQTNVADAIWPSGAGGIKALFDTATILRNLQTRVVDQASGGVLSTAAVVLARPGTGTGSPLPAEVSEVLTLRTARAGASYRGRMYFPALKVSLSSSVGKVDSGAISTMVTSLANAMIAMNADVTYTSASCVVYSRKHSTTEDVTSVDMGDVFDAQRRRRNSGSESRTSATV